MIGLVSLVCVILVGLASIASFAWSVDQQKLSEYECGFEPFDKATRLPFDVHFYLVGILFLIFDVEIALLLPYGLSLQQAHWCGYAVVTLFILFLGYFFYYELSLNVLDWTPAQSTPVHNGLGVGVFTALGILWLTELSRHGVYYTRLVGSLVSILGISLSFVLCNSNLETSLLSITENTQNLYFLFILCTLLFLLVSAHWKTVPETIVLFLYFALYGCGLLLAQNLFMTIGCLIGLSMNLYAWMVLFQRNGVAALESGFKYFYASNSATIYLLFGLICFFFSQTSLYLSHWTANGFLATVGILCFFIGLAIKLAAAPLHFMIPMAYEEASYPVLGLLITPTKVVLLLLLSSFATFLYTTGVASFCTVTGIISIIIGCLFALRARRIKLFFAYTSINNLGFLLLALGLQTPEALGSALLFAIFYFAAMVLAWYLLQQEPTYLSEFFPTKLFNFGGLVPAILLSLAILSMAGLPPLPGFFGKLALLSSYYGGGLWWAVGAGLLTSAISIYYYLRLLVLLITQHLRFFAATKNISCLWNDVYYGFLIGIFLGAVSIMICDYRGGPINRNPTTALIQHRYWNYLDMIYPPNWRPFNWLGRNEVYPGVTYGKYVKRVLVTGIILGAAAKHIGNQF